MVAITGPQGANPTPLQQNQETRRPEPAEEPRKDEDAVVVRTDAEARAQADQAAKAAAERKAQAAETAPSQAPDLSVVA